MAAGSASTASWRWRCTRRASATTRAARASSAGPATSSPRRKSRRSSGARSRCKHAKSWRSARHTSSKSAPAPAASPPTCCAVSTNWAPCRKRTPFSISPANCASGNAKPSPKKSRPCSTACAGSIDCPRISTVWSSPMSCSTHYRYAWSNGRKAVCRNAACRFTTPGSSGVIDRPKDVCSMQRRPSTRSSSRLTVISARSV